MTHLFISHASEDKDRFVRPLAHALKAKGLKLWYDEYSLRPGDSLRRSIDRGLAECSAGLIVLSPAFFSKEWPQRELDGLFAAEIAGKTRLIPLWLDLGFSQVAAHSPLMADRLALNAKEGIQELAEKISDLYPPPERFSGHHLASRLEAFKHFDLFAGEALYAGCWHRFLQVNAFKEQYGLESDEITAPLSDEVIDRWPSALDDQLRELQERIRERWQLSTDVYLTTDEPIRESEFGWWKDTMAAWSSGTLAREESREFVEALDLDEFDEYYVLIDVPNFSISRAQRKILEQALIALGCGFDSEWKELDELCARLRQQPRDG